MSIHRAFWLALLVRLTLPMPAHGAESAAAAALDPAETGESVPDPAGRGFAIGETGLTVGGYLTGEAEDLEGSDYYSKLEGNLFVFYEPARFFRLFADLEMTLDEVALERGYLDLSYSDAANLRLGKFLTPIGRWNQAHIEPLTWTTSEPLMIETVFDDTVSGASVHGSVFPSGGALSYAVYASLVDSIATDPDEEFVEHSGGGRVEWASLGGWTAGLSYYASKPLVSTRWHHLGGTDVLWHPHPRLELSAELLAGEGSRASGAVRAGYVQSAVRTWDSLYLVGRLESVKQPQLPAARLGTVGLVWAPRPWVRLKLDYTFANEAGADGEPGVRASLSFLY